MAIDSSTQASSPPVPTSTVVSAPLEYPMATAWWHVDCRQAARGGHAGAQADASSLASGDASAAATSAAGAGPASPVAGGATASAPWPLDASAASATSAAAFEMHTPSPPHTPLEQSLPPPHSGLHT